MFRLLAKGLYQFAAANKSKSLYQVLQVSRTASLEQIKTNYYKLAKEYHPDTQNQNPNFAEIFKQISEAYNTLKDPAKRKQYDQQNFTPEGQKKQYKFYDNQHSYGYNQKSYRKTQNPYQSTNPFESQFNESNPYRQTGNTNPYNSDFSHIYKNSQKSGDKNQTWQEYVKNQHRKNIYENRKTAIKGHRRFNFIMIGILGTISVYIVGQLTFMLYQFNSHYRVRSYPQKLDPRELLEYQTLARMTPRKDFY